MTENDLYYSKEEGWRIQSLSSRMDLVDSQPEENKLQSKVSGQHDSYSDLSITLTNMSRIKIFNTFDLEPPTKRKKLSLMEYAETPLPPPMPRLNSPIPFFISSIDPDSNGLLDDLDFIDFVSKGSPKKNNITINRQLVSLKNMIMKMN